MSRDSQNESRGESNPYKFSGGAESEVAETAGEVPRRWVLLSALIASMSGAFVAFAAYFPITTRLGLARVVESPLLPWGIVLLVIGLVVAVFAVQNQDK